jgi:group I intron endonuclease
MNIYIIYWIHRSCHTNFLTEGYIGVTDDIKRRMKEHKNQKQNIHLERAFNKYDDMIIDIIFLNFSKSYCYYIEYLLRPNEKIGYNIAIGGGKPPSSKGREPWIKGKHQSEETRKKQSDAIKGEKHPNYGKHHSEETRQKQSISAKKRGFSENSIIKMAEKNKGKHHSKESIQKGIETKKRNGYKPSDETKLKISDALKNKKQSEETILKRVKTYKIVTPTGEEMTIINLLKFCRENKLDYSNITKKCGSKGYKSTKILKENE